MNHMRTQKVTYDHYIDILKRKAELLTLSGRYQDSLKTLDQALFAATNAVLENKNPTVEEASIYVSIGTINRLCGEYEKAVEGSQKGLLLIESIGDVPERSRGNDVKNDAFNNLGIICQNQGKYKEAIEYFQQYLKLAEVMGDKQGFGRACGNMGSTYFDQGEYDRAIDLYQKYLEISEQTGNKRAIGITNGNLGNIYFARGDYDRALEFYKRDLIIAQEIGNRRETGIATGNIANIHYAKGEYRQALEFYLRYSMTAMGIGDRFGYAMASGNLGAVYKELGLLDKSLEHFKSALEIFTLLNDRQGIGYCRFNIGTLSLDSGDTIGAEENLDLAEAVLLEIGDKSTLIETYWSKAGVAIAYSKDNPEELEKAGQYGGLALALSQEIGSNSGKAGSLLVLGKIDRLAGIFHSAIDKIETAIKIYKTLGQKKRLAEAYDELSRLMIEAGEEAKAQENRKLAKAIFLDIGLGYDGESN